MSKIISIPDLTPGISICVYIIKNLFLKFETKKKTAHFLLVKTVIPKLGDIYSIFNKKQPNDLIKIQGYFSSEMACCTDRSWRLSV